MVYSSQLFIYGFMPLFFLFYFLVTDRWKNTLLCFGSLIFYFIGAGSTVAILLASIWIRVCTQITD
jgi:hypothetical protein